MSFGRSIPVWFGQTRKRMTPYTFVQHSFAPRFDRLLAVAVAFGLQRVRHEWSVLLAEDTPEARRARASVDRILTNIEEGFSSVASRD
jgi:hypothetical protein